MVSLNAALPQPPPLPRPSAGWGRAAPRSPAAPLRTPNPPPLRQAPPFAGAGPGRAAGLRSRPTPHPSRPPGAERAGLRPRRRGPGRVPGSPRRGPVLRHPAGPGPEGACRSDRGGGRNSPTQTRVLRALGEPDPAQGWPRRAGGGGGTPGQAWAPAVCPAPWAKAAPTHTAGAQSK